MSKVKDFNIILNNSASRSFGLWSDYRFNLTEYIISQSTKIKEKYDSCLLIGCGSSNDIDLHKILKVAGKITLSDIDESAIKEAIKTYNLQKNSIDVEVVDYTGINSSNLFNDFVSLSLKNTPEMMSKIIDQLFKTIENYRFLEKNMGKYDLVVISPIYTQLLYSQFRMDLGVLSDLNYPSKSIEYLESKFLEKMPDLLKRFNQNLIDLANVKATVVCVSDIFEFAVGTDEHKKIIELATIENGINDYHLNYRNQYGYGLGDYGIADLSSYLDVLDSKWFFWNFDEKRLLLVMAKVMKKYDKIRKD